MKRVSLSFMTESLQHGLYYRCSAPLFVGGLGLGVDLQEALDVYLEQEVPLG
jgi:hypothetical protein